MKKTIIALSLLSLFGCKKDLNEDIQSVIPQLSGENTLDRMVLFYGNDSIEAKIEGDEITALIPADSINRKKLSFKYQTKGIAVNTGDGTFVDGKGTISVEGNTVLDVVAKNTAMRRYNVKIRLFSGIPIMWMNPEANVGDKVNYIKTPFKFDALDSVFSGTTTMRGRGNSTWGTEKNPYKVKFENKTSLLGMPADKEWALLANYYDKSLLRNDVAFELSERLQREWTPKRRFVDLFMWGKYNGNYLLTETIKEGKERVNIDLKKGGYLLEVNQKGQEDDPRIYFPGTPAVPMDVKEASIEPKLIEKEMADLYNAVAKGDYTYVDAHFDMDAAVSWYIVTEVICSVDQSFYSSVYIQKKDKDSKIKMGPVWDFDLSTGNYNEIWTNPEGWYVRSTHLLGGLIMHDPAYKAAIKAKWSKYREQILSLPEYISKKKKEIDLSARANFLRFDINRPMPNTNLLHGNYDAEVAYLKDYVTKRVNWLDGEFKK